MAKDMVDCPPVAAPGAQHWTSLIVPTRGPGGQADQAQGEGETEDGAREIEEVHTERAPADAGDL